MPTDGVGLAAPEERRGDPKRAATAEGSGPFVGAQEGSAGYLPAVARSDVTVLKVVCNCEPRAFTTAVIATEMPAAINLYSMAVAPD